MCGDVWVANPELARESGTVWERAEDRVALGGAEPIYVYEPHCYQVIKRGMRSELEELVSQMSSDWERLYGRYLCVLSLPRELPISTAHNASPFVKIVPSVKKTSLCAAYKIVRKDTFWEQGCLTEYVTEDFKNTELHTLLETVE